MNNKLLCSSTIIGIFILCISIFFYNFKLLPLYIITYIGIVTSIINHGLTSKVAKNLDRFIMVLSAIIYIYYGLQINNFYVKITILSIVGLMMLLYISSKIIKKFTDNDDISTNVHITTHCITLLPFSIIIINDYLTSKQYISV